MVRRYAKQSSYPSIIFDVKIATNVFNHSDSDYIPTAPTVFCTMLKCLRVILLNFKHIFYSHTRRTSLCALKKYQATDFFENDQNMNDGFDEHVFALKPTA